jgi:hypothetical protein
MKPSRRPVCGPDAPRLLNSLFFMKHLRLKLKADPLRQRRTKNAMVYGFVLLFSLTSVSMKRFGWIF